MGKGLGFADTRGTMFFEIDRILREHRPQMVMLENVKQLRTHDKGRTLEVILDKVASLGYTVDWRIMNALDFGLPQKRERITIVGFQDRQVFERFEWPICNGQRASLSDVLEPDQTVASEYWASSRIVEARKRAVGRKEVFYPSVWHENRSKNVSVLPYACALRHGASHNYLPINGVRRPTSRELLRLQGFPDDFPIVVSHHEIRRQAGSSVPVPVIRSVAQAMDTAGAVTQFTELASHPRAPGVPTGASSSSISRWPS